MAIDVKLKKQTADAFKRKLKDARVGLSNNMPAMAQAATYLDQWVQQNFQGKGNKVGGWAPFTYGGRLTTKGKANAQSSDNRYINTAAVLLQDTGALRHSFLPFIRKGVAGIGSELPYSKPHNEGAGGLPQRRMLPKESDVKVELKEILGNFIKIQMRKANA